MIRTLLLAALCLLPSSLWAAVPVGAADVVTTADLAAAPVAIGEQPIREGAEVYVDIRLTGMDAADSACQFQVWRTLPDGTSERVGGVLSRTLTGSESQSVEVSTTTTEAGTYYVTVASANTSDTAVSLVAQWYDQSEGPPPATWATSLEPTPDTPLAAPRRVVGDASLLLDDDAADYYASAAGEQTLRDIGTKDWIIRWAMDSTGRAADETGYPVVTSIWPVGFSRSANTDDSIRVNYQLGSNAFVYFRTGGVERARVTLPHAGDVVVGASRYFVLKKTGNLLTLYAIITDPLNGAYVVRSADADNSTTEINLDTLLSTTGRLIIGSAHTGYTTPGQRNLAGLVVAVLPSGATWASVDADTDAGVARYAIDPHEAIHRNLDDFDALHSFDLCDASGNRAKLTAMGPIPTTHKLCDLHSSIELTYGSNQSGRPPEGRPPYHVASNRVSNATSSVASPQADRVGQVVFGGEHYTRSDNNYGTYIARYGLDGNRIAPPVPLAWVHQYIDASDSGTVKTIYGNVDGISETHESITAEWDKANNALWVGASFHNDVEDNQPETGDTLVAGGFVYRMVSGALPSGRPMPFPAGATGVQRSTSYIAQATHSGASYFATRAADQSGGILRLFKATASTLDEFDLTEAAGSSPTGAGLPSEADILGGTHLLTTWSTRASGTGQGYAGVGLAIIPLSADWGTAAFAADGTDLSSQIGSVEWDNTSLYVAPVGGPVTPWVEADADYDEILCRGGQIVVTKSGTTYVGFVTWGGEMPRDWSPSSEMRYTRLSLHLYRWNSSTPSLTHVRSHDLAPIAELVAPDRNPWSTVGALDFEVSSPRIVPGDDGKITIAISRSNGRDISADVPGGRTPHEIGESWGLLEIQDITAEKLAIRMGNDFHAGGLGASSVTLTKVDGLSDAMLVGLGVAGATNASTGNLRPETRRIVRLQPLSGQVLTAPSVEATSSVPTATVVARYLEGESAEVQLSARVYQDGQLVTFGGDTVTIGLRDELSGGFFFAPTATVTGDTINATITGSDVADYDQAGSLIAQVIAPIDGVTQTIPAGTIDVAGDRLSRLLADGSDVRQRLQSLALAPTPNTATGTTARVADVSLSGGGTADARDVDKRYTWSFPRSGSATTASNIVSVNAGYTAAVQFDLDGVLLPGTTVQSVSSFTIPGGATIANPRAHISRRKIMADLSGVTTPGKYTASATFTTADSQTIVVEGDLEVR
ncbi:MAG: hypothetical protein AAF663_01990 [Planctomycetota bacterium]